MNSNVKNTLLLIAFIFILIFGTTVYTIMNTYSNKFDSMNDVITNQAKTIIELNKDCEEMEKHLAEVENEINGLKEDITDIKN